MDGLLNRLERRYGRYAFDNLTLVLVGTQLVALVLGLARPGFAQLLMLDPDAVSKGQPWRLLTYIFLPPSFDPLWAILGIYWLYTIGTALETQWGAFKYQIFWFLGAALTTLGAFVFGVPTGNEYLLMSMFLAFATVWPDYEILVFLIIPVKVKWLALLDVLFLISAIGNAEGWAVVSPVIAVGNYLLFFAGDLLALARGKVRTERRSARRNKFAAKPNGVPNVRRCAACGITSEDDADMDFRVCTCDKHAGPTEFCITHARSH